ncbi:hypothetical protein [Sphingobacterium hotanense]|uniref:hypothetical protein n=1 Tax=Sphingobacterium hotanense TaxID=649196 RepID=UPI0021A4266D|nr:hypothetical protein [Sphingobacterium hotanense]MCT1525699.1 hypothetical protein [Sphingobacterium hotanense]
MKKNRIIWCLLFALIGLCVSCTSMQRAVNKNNVSTNKLFLSLYEKNGNAFYLASTYATFSTVWTYAQDSIYVYRLAKGKVVERLSFKESGIDELNIPAVQELNKDIGECGNELDGDLFSFMARGGRPERQDLPISIDCFTNKKYQSSFLNKIVESINKHKLWDIRYL